MSSRVERTARHEVVQQVDELGPGHLAEHLTEDLAGGAHKDGGGQVADTEAGGKVDAGETRGDGHGVLGPARRTMARAAGDDGSLMSMPRKCTRVRSELATAAKPPSSAWQATQVDWNQLTTAGPPPRTAEVRCPGPPRRARSKLGAWAGVA